MLTEGFLAGASMEGVLTELAGVVTGGFLPGASMEGVLMDGGCLLEPEAAVLTEPREGAISPLIEGVATLRLGLRSMGWFTDDVEVCMTGIDAATLDGGVSPLIEGIFTDGVSLPRAGVCITEVDTGVWSDCRTGELADLVL